MNRQWCYFKWDVITLVQLTSTDTLAWPAFQWVKIFGPAESALCTMVLHGHEQLHLLVWVGACQCENLADFDIFTVITDHPLICWFLRRH